MQAYDRALFLLDIKRYYVSTYQVRLVVKNPPANAGDIRDLGSIPRIWKTPWRRPWQPTSVFLPKESHGKRNLGGYGP